jgi:cytochrome c oxidase assembly protein subunit 15
VLVWVCVQGAFGALTVTMRLFPLIVTLHLLGGLLLLALLALLALRYDRWQCGSQPLNVPTALRLGLWVCTALLAVQIALGGWVSTNYAVLACSEFPTCQGRWWPDMALAEGFRPWRELGMNAEGGNISFAALTGIHVMHRLGALILIPALMVLAGGLWRHTVLRRQARLIFALVALQLLTGVANVVLGWPLLAAVLHTGGAAGLLLTLTWLLGLTRSAPSAQSRLPHMRAAS